MNLDVASLCVDMTGISQCNSEVTTGVDSEVVSLSSDSDTVSYTRGTVNTETLCLAYSTSSRVTVNVAESYTWTYNGNTGTKGTL